VPKLRVNLAAKGAKKSSSKLDLDIVHEKKCKISPCSSSNLQIIQRSIKVNLEVPEACKKK
jgi:hypothetical protein